MDNTITAILLGILEGLTEFLPVASTGHLILAQAFFGYDPEQWRQFNIVITGNSVSTPQFSRQISETVRVRNDAVQGTCP